MALAGDLDLNKSAVVMQYLQPYQTHKNGGYLVTLAMAYIPSDMVDKLSMDIMNGGAPLYNNPDASVKTLSSMIDPTIPVLAGTAFGQNGSPVNSANNGATSSGTGNGGAPGGGDDGSSAPVRPSSVGIAVGAVAGAAVYGAAMFLVARRYKKRKASHQRTSSVQSGGAVRRPGETSNLMTGARNSYGSRQPPPATGRGSRNSDRSDESGSGRSGRTYISPPVMAENSLGWN